MPYFILNSFSMSFLCRILASNEVNLFNREY